MSSKRYVWTRRERRARILAVILIGALAGLYVDHTNQRWNRLGRAAYVAYQDQRANRFFDRLTAHPHHLLFEMIGSILGMVILALFYELVVAGFTAILPASVAEGE